MEKQFWTLRRWKEKIMEDGNADLPSAAAAMTADELNVAKYRLDRERFDLEKKKADREGRFLFRHSSVLITSAVSIATVVVAVASVRINWQISEQSRLTQEEQTRRREISERENTTRSAQETERKASLDLLQYITANEAVIFSQQTEKQTRIRDIMEAAFPKTLLRRVFPNLAETAPTTDGPNVWQSEQRKADIENVTKTVNLVPAVSGSSDTVPVTAQEIITRLTGSDRRIEAERLAATQGKERALTVQLLISSLLPQTDKSSYRFNLYAALSLAKMSAGWTGTPAQLASLSALKLSGNYQDATFKTWVDKALSNYRQATQE